MSSISSVNHPASDGSIVPDARPDPRDQVVRLRHQAARSGTIFLMARLGIQGFQWAVTLLLARLLLPDDYGLMATAGVFLGLADLLAEAGLGRALIHKKELAPAEKAQAFTLCLLFSAVLYLALWISAPLVAEQLGAPQFTLFLRVTALALLFVPLQAVSGALLEREVKFGVQSAIQTAISVFQSLIVLILAFKGFGAWALGLGALSAKVVQSVVTWYLSKWRLSLAWPSAPGWGLARYGVIISLSSLLWYVYSHADFAVLSALEGPVLLGYYFMAFQLISIPLEKLTVNINQIAFATFCRLQDDPSRMRNWFIRLVALLVLVGLPMMAGLVLVADDAIPLLLGERWRPSVFPLQLLSPIGALMVVSNALSPFFNALGRPDVNLKFTAVCAVILPAAFLALGWAAGMVGICLAWLILYPGLVAALIHRTRPISGVSVSDLLRPLRPILLSALGMSVTVLVVQRALAGDGLATWRLAATVLTGAAIYALLIVGLARQTVMADVLVLVRELRGRGAEE